MNTVIDKIAEQKALYAYMQKRALFVSFDAMRESARKKEPKYMNDKTGGYALAASINGVDYYLPNDEELSAVIGIHQETGLAVDTGFFEMDDIEYPESGYAFVVGPEGFLVSEWKLS